MVEQSWVDELGEKSDPDQRVYVILSMFLKISEGARTPDLKKDPAALWKHALGYLKQSEDGDIGMFLLVPLAHY